ncbi:MAG: hypothetical protein P8080_03805 [Gammaproteobacteria bacterium]
MNAHRIATPYEARTPPGPRGRRHPGRWHRPDGSLAERLARARLVYLLSRNRGIGDWVALGIAALAVAGVLAVGGPAPDQGRLRAPHLNLDYALTAVRTGAPGAPSAALVHAGGAGLARLLDRGDLVAVETRDSAGWYRVEEVRIVSCGAAAVTGAPLVMVTGCGRDGDSRVIIGARPLATGGWI